MKHSRYDWSKVSAETAQLLLQAAHDFDTAINVVNSNAFTTAVKQARKEALIYEADWKEVAVLAAAREFYNSTRASLSHSQQHEDAMRDKLFEALHAVYNV